MATRCTQLLQKYVISSPIGKITVMSCKEGLHNVDLDPEIDDENFLPDTGSKVTVINKMEESRDVYLPLQEALIWLETYFENPHSTKKLKKPNLCILKDDSKFRTKVLEMLYSKVDCGETITYKGLATYLNNPGAVRAVGSAMKNNPICIIIPCHRVIRQDGMGLYSGGKKQKIKKWLLQHEGSNT